MQITTEITKISKTVQDDLNLILNALSKPSIHFTYFLIVLAKNNVDSFT